MSIFDFFRTAPKTKSKKVTDLEKAGKSALLVDAVEAERSSRKGGGNTQAFDEGRLTVKRVGEYS